MMKKMYEYVHIRCFFLSVAIPGVLIIYIGIFAVLSIAWHSDHVFRMEAEFLLALAINRMDSIITHAKIAVENVYDIHPLLCSGKTAERLHHQAAVVPNVRSFHLIQHGKIISSSLYDMYDKVPSSGRQIKLHEVIIQTHGTRVELFIAGNNTLILGRTVLFYLHNAPHGYPILSAVNSYYISNILGLLNHPTVIYLQVADKIENVTCEISEYRKIKKESQFISRHYSYVIHISRPTLLTRIKYTPEFAFWSLRLVASVLLTLRSAYGFHQFSCHCLSPVNSLEFAIKNEEIVPRSQSVVTANGRLRGGEILARWEHPELDILQPGIFIPLAKESGLILPLTRSLMHQVSSFSKTCEHVFPEGFYCGFNISPLFLNDIAFYEDCIHFISSGVNARLLLEITERHPYQDTEPTGSKLNRLRQLRVLVAIDDFGTGHASPEYLHHYEFDFLKIDRLFISDLVNKFHIGQIVQKLTELADGMNIKFVAEEVEEKCQLAELRRMYIDYYHFLFSHPLLLQDIFVK